MLSAMKTGHALLKVEDCDETLPPIFPAFLQSVHPRKQKQIAHINKVKGKHIITHQVDYLIQFQNGSLKAVQFDF